MTRKPRSASSWAAVRPAIPPPKTATRRPGLAAKRGRPAMAAVEARAPPARTPRRERGVVMTPSGREHRDSTTVTTLLGRRERLRAWSELLRASLQPLGMPAETVRDPTRAGQRGPAGRRTPRRCRTSSARPAAGSAAGAEWRSAAGAGRAVPRRRRSAAPWSTPSARLTGGSIAVIRSGERGGLAIAPAHVQHDRVADRGRGRASRRARRTGSTRRTSPCRA